MTSQVMAPALRVSGVALRDGATYRPAAGESPVA